jgi:4-hydroxy-tetrahydrodipicolinate synthase
MMQESESQRSDTRALLSGLSAFPLTPMSESGVDEGAFVGLVHRLASTGVDSITVLGSTGAYAYLTSAERARLVRLALAHAGDVPVLVGIGALRTSQVLALAEDAQTAGAAGVLLAPVSYQRLTPEEVFGLYEDVTTDLDLPLVVYDNPGTTGFTFSDELYRDVAALPHVGSIKIPGVPGTADGAGQRVARLRALLPAHVTIGVSGDSTAALGLNAGCDTWYSVIAGTVPVPALTLTRAALAGDAAAATAESARLQPLWTLFEQYGSFRVVATIAAHLGLTALPNLPRPVRALPAAAVSETLQVAAQLELQ